jgi:Flp pilus assembly pilin Flp
MKEMFRNLRKKLQDNKGEVSVEWALVAVVMCVVILAAFLPGVQGALEAAIQSITSALTTA